MIAIRVVSRAGEALATPSSATFGEAGGDIGRAVECTLVLPDAERRISRRHAQIACRGGRHTIRQIGAGLAVELDGVPLDPNIEYPLEPGAQIRIGPYLLRAIEEPGVAAAGARASVFRDLLGTVIARAAPADAGPSTLRPPELDLVIGEPTGSGAEATPPQALPQDLFEALYVGLGVPAPEASLRSPQQMRLVGALLRSALGGTLELLAARAIAKRELGANPTLLQTRENNPLKFSPDTDAALAHLLGPVQRGFTPPLAAVHDAFSDLRAHEIAVLSGTRAALDAVLARFSPEALEARLAPQRVWDNLLPTARKARLWESYEEQHAQILREIEDDFDSLFGRAFVQAYEAQLAQLEGSLAPPQRRA
jgi:predicted component of type VI protein secretion system